MAMRIAATNTVNITAALFTKLDTKQKDYIEEAG